MHNGAASIDCNDCKRHVYNLKTGKVVTYDTEFGQEVLKRDGDPPCDSCPKGSPENWEKNLRLSWRNQMTYDVYRRIKATGVESLAPHLRRCPVVSRNVYLIDQVLESARAELKSMIIRETKEKVERGEKLDDE